MSAPSVMSSWQVIVVGGGPVGLGLAVELGQRGVRCLLIERFLTPPPIPKGQNLTQRTMEHFHDWGVEDELRASRTIPKSYGIGGMTAYGTLLGTYQNDWMQRELVRPFYFTDNERLPQYITEAVLRRRLTALPSVETLYGWTVDSVEQDADGVTVGAVERDSGERRSFRSDYVAGCDGARSVVREQAGITQTRSDHDRLMVLLVFKSPELHDLLACYPGKSYYCVLKPEMKGYWQFFGRVDLGTTWFFHAPVPLGTTKDNFDFRDYVYKAAGATFGMEFDHIGFWDLRFAAADTYRNGRLFIAGDAAHSHPPYGGYGINTGLEDARNLGWKLAATLQGWGGKSLLDSYTPERQPVFVSTADDFIEKSIHVDRDFLAAFDPARDRAAFETEWERRRTGALAEVGAFVPHYEGSPIVDGPQGARCGALGVHALAARPGHHLTPQVLSDGRNVFDALSNRFTLLAFDSETAAFEQAARELGLPLTVVRDSRMGGREQFGAGLVLVRPDRFVAWTGDSAPADPVSVLRKMDGM
jgi:2-polyprenyl-6-methoxyphenol hydroxylase-like FAD-dependent oxidoreductase